MQSDYHHLGIKCTKKIIINSLSFKFVMTVTYADIFQNYLWIFSRSFSRFLSEQNQRSPLLSEIFVLPVVPFGM